MRLPPSPVPVLRALVNEAQKGGSIANVFGRSEMEIGNFVDELRRRQASSSTLVEWGECS